MIKIGAKDWVRELKSKTEQLGPEFWSDFTPSTKSEVHEIETQTRRELDPEFVEFYRSIGHGWLINSGSAMGMIFPPQTIITGVAARIKWITTVRTPRVHSDDLKDPTELWLSRGQFNPCPRNYTDEVLTVDGVKLYDLLQFGTDFLGFHQLYVGPDPAPFRCCLLQEAGEITNRAASTSEWLDSIIKQCLEHARR